MTLRSKIEILSLPPSLAALQNCRSVARPFDTDAALSQSVRRWHGFRPLRGSVHRLTRRDSRML